MGARLVSDASAEAFNHLLSEPLSRVLRAGSQLRTVDRLRDLAEEHEAASEHRLAAKVLREALEVDPDDASLRDALLRNLHPLYPGSRGLAEQASSSVNHTTSFFSKIGELVHLGRATLLSQMPTVYVLHGLVSADEASEIMRLGDAIRAPWLREHPLVCFHEGVKKMYTHLRPALRNGLVSDFSSRCFNQSVSLAAHRAGVPRYSTSTSVFRSEEALIDEVGRRLERLVGLRDSNANAFQLLSYDPDASYHVHTDCTQGGDLLNDMQARMASVLLYMTSDESYGGGGTGFPQIERSFNPKMGDALVFYNWNGRECDERTSHLSETNHGPGTKHVLQRWYLYRQDRFFDFKPWRNNDDVGFRRPWQAVVHCEDVNAHLEASEELLSCRWYNKPQDFVHRPLDRGGNPPGYQLTPLVTAAKGRTAGSTEAKRRGPRATRGLKPSKPAKEEL